MMPDGLLRALHSHNPTQIFGYRGAFVQFLSYHISHIISSGKY